MYGAERVHRAELRDVALFHILILAPNREVRGGGSGIETRCLQATETLTWQVGNWKTGPFDRPDLLLQLRYDGRRKVLTVGRDELPTADSNCFVVRLDDRWQPSVARVQLLISERLPLGVLIGRMRAAASDSPDVTSARLYSEVHPAK